MLSPATTQSDSLSRGHCAFLHRAAHDPQFLDALQDNPQAALAEYDLSIDLEQIPSRVRVPDAESIQAALAENGEEGKTRTFFPWMPFLV